jgi:hypothetical protein
MAKTKTKKRSSNPKHPTATYPRAKLKLPKGVKSPKRRRNPDAVAPAAQAAPPAPAPPSPVTVQVTQPSPAPAAPAAAATKNPGRSAFTWKGQRYEVALNMGTPFYRKLPGGTWLSVWETLERRKLHPSLRLLLKARADGLTLRHTARAAKKLAVRAAKKLSVRAALEGRRNVGAVERAAAASLRAERFERARGQKRAALKKGKKNVGKSCGMKRNPTLRWESKPPKVWIAESTVTFEDIYRHTRSTPIAFRIDGRDPGGYRVDINTLIGMPWEAIDGGYSGHGVATLAAAKAHAALWLKAANEQRTLTPRVPSAVKNPSRSAKARPKKAPVKKDFARILKLFRHYVKVFAKVYPNVAHVGLKVDATIHDAARHFGMTGLLAGDKAPVVRIAPELASEPVTVQTGIIIHELAHASFMAGYGKAPRGYDENERATDKRAEKVTGLKIYYDSRGVEVAGRGAKGTRPRPAGLR